jgi:glycosyltransferase involved in cell wall biosynthesis
MYGLPNATGFFSRNEQARGEYIAFWDDDDYSRPHRLERQLAAILESGNAVTAYRQIPSVSAAKASDEWFLPPRSPHAVASLASAFKSLSSRSNAALYEW